MGVAVYKSGHYHSSRSIHIDGFAGQRQIFHAPCRADFLYDAIVHQQRPILNYGQFFESGTAPRLLRPTQRHQLARAPNE
jgi:hypothetical protein